MPAEIRARLGIVPGLEVSIELHGDTINVKPKAGWDEFFLAGQEIRVQMLGSGTRPITDPDKLQAAISEAKVAELERNLGQDEDSA